MKFLTFVFSFCVAIGFTENPQDAILKRYLQEGDIATLYPLLKESTPSEISERLKIIARSKPLTKFGESSVIAESLPKIRYDTSSAVVDSTGVIHIVISEIRSISEKDYLGNKQRWQTQILYINNQSGNWSRPEVILENEIYIDKLKLLVDDQNAIHLFVTGHNGSTHNTTRGIFPGGYEIFTMQRTQYGGWSKPETVLTHAKLLHSFDACFDSKKNLHLVWAPWESNDVLELLHYRIRSASGWQKEEILPAAPNRNATNPQIQCMENEIDVFAPGQTTDYNKLSLYEWKKTGDSWTQPSLIAEPLYDFDFSLITSADKVAISIPYSKKFVIYSGYGNKGLKPVSELYLAKAEDDEMNLPFVFGKDNSFVHLVPYKNGVLLVSKKLNQPPTSVVLSEILEENHWGGISMLTATKNEYISLFNIQDVERRQKLVINRIPLNSINWQLLGDIASMLRGRDGLRESELCLLTKEVVKQASIAEKEDDIRTAMDRYLYLIENFSPSGGDCNYSYDAMNQLQRLYLKGSDADRLHMEAAIENNADNLKELPQILNGLKEIHRCQLEVSMKAYLQTPIDPQLKQAFENEKKLGQDMPSAYEVKSSVQTINEIRRRAQGEESWLMLYTFGNKCHYGFLKIAELLREPDPRFRLYAATALYRYDQEKSLPFLKGMLSDQGCYFPKLLSTNSDVLPDYGPIKISEEVRKLLESQHSSFNW